MSVFAKQFSDVCDRLLKGVPEPFRNHTPLACYRETLYQTLRKDADFIDAYNGDDSDETIIEGLRRILAKEPAYSRIPFWRMTFTVEAEDGRGAWCRIGHWRIDHFTHQVEHFGSQGRNPLPAAFTSSLSLCGKEGDEDVHIGAGIGSSRRDGGAPSETGDLSTGMTTGRTPRLLNRKRESSPSGLRSASMIRIRIFIPHWRIRRI